MRALSSGDCSMTCTSLVYAAWMTSFAISPIKVGLFYGLYLLVGAASVQHYFRGSVPPVRRTWQHQTTGRLIRDKLSPAHPYRPRHRRLLDSAFLATPLSQWVPQESSRVGIDWGQAQHDVCFLDEAGEPIARMFLVVIWHVLRPRRRPPPPLPPLGLPLPSR